MTDHPGYCTVPNCHRPRHVSKYGKPYTKCYDHFQESQRAARQRHNPATRVKPVENVVGNTLQVLVVDWAKEAVYHVEATITCVEAMPKTYGLLLKIIAEAAQGGCYVSQSQAFKPSDFEVEKEALGDG